MFEKKNRLSQQSLLYMKLASGYRTLSIVVLMKNAQFFYKILIADGCFGKYRLNMPFCNDIGCCFYFLEYALQTPPLGHCFLVFKYISIILLWKIFIEQFRHKNHLVEAAFRTDLFIRKNKDPEFSPIGHSVGTLEALYLAESRVPHSQAFWACLLNSLMVIECQLYKN